MNISNKDTAVVVIDPQNDFLSEEGVTWELVGDSVTENGTVENIERLFQTAKEDGYEVFVSPHYYYPTDHGWQFGGTIEKVMHEINMFGRKDALSLEGFAGSGAGDCKSAQGLRTGKQRPGPAAAQTGYR